MTTDLAPARLPRAVRTGYGSGSVATGAFGWVLRFFVLAAWAYALLDRLQRPVR